MISFINEFITFPANVNYFQLPNYLTSEILNFFFEHLQMYFQALNQFENRYSPILKENAIENNYRDISLSKSFE